MCEDKGVTRIFQHRNYAIQVGCVFIHESRKHVTMCERVDDDTVVGEEEGLSSTLDVPLETFSLEYCGRTHAR